MIDAYPWLYENLVGQVYDYWTSTEAYSGYYWIVDNVDGILDFSIESEAGVRPVITIHKEHKPNKTIKNMKN